MAEKEAVVLILDVGPDMSDTYFQQSLTAIDMILQRKLFAESKDEVALVLFGTEDMGNELSYSNVTVARPLGPVDWHLLKYIENDIKQGTSPADFVDAIVVAMDHIHKNLQGKKGFTSKRIVLFSNVSNEFSDDQLNDIIGSLKEDSIEFDVIGPNLDDDSDNNDKPKSLQQKTGEKLLRHMLNNDFVDGASYSF
jgi:ATP-dependent DNA helicase 2 subunit 2